MLNVSNAFNEAFKSPTRQVLVRVTMKNIVYTNNDIFNVEYVGGSITGETFNIGSVFSSSVKITFTKVIEAVKQLDKIKLEFGIVLADGSKEFVSMGYFFVDKYNPDRNANRTVIEALDQMTQLERVYKSKLTYPARIKDVALEIANLSGSVVDQASFERLSTSAIIKFEGKTYRQAIGLIAQFAGGFTIFDRDGKLSITTLSDPSFAISTAEYFSRGLTKNETMYTLGGISCKVSTKNGDTTTDFMLQSGSPLGNQIALENSSMTQILLDSIYQQLKDTNYYPYTLSWRGNPALEAGDWISMSDTKDNSFKMPNLSYKLSFSGGLKATSSADTSSVSQASASYRGPLKQQVLELQGWKNSAGGWTYTGTVEPSTPKEGDVWFKPNGPDTETWIYEGDKWVFQTSTAGIRKVAEEMTQAQKDIKEAKKSADDAVDKANKNIADIALIDIELIETKELTSKAQNDATKAITDAKTAYDKAAENSGKIVIVTQDIDKVKGSITTKVEKTDFDKSLSRITQSESSITQNANAITQKVSSTDVENILTGKAYATKSELNQTSDSLTSTISGVKVEVDKKANQTQVTQLTQNLDGFKTTVSSTYLNKTDATNLYPTKTTVSTQINQSATDITSSVQSWTNNKLTGYSTIKQTDDSIISAVSGINAKLRENLISNSDFRNDGNSWGMTSNSNPAYNKISKTDSWYSQLPKTKPYKYIRFEYAKLDADKWIVSTISNPSDYVGTQLRFSTYYYGNSTPENGFEFYSRVTYDGKAIYFNAGTSNAYGKLGGWNRIDFLADLSKFTNPSLLTEINLSFRVKGATNSSGNVSFTGFMVTEDGNLYDWSYDYSANTSYSQIVQLSDQIVSVVTDKADKSQVTQLSDNITSTVTGLTNESLITTQMMKDTTLFHPNYSDMPMVEVPVTNGETYTVSTNQPWEANAAHVFFIRVISTQPVSSINGVYDEKSITLPALSDKIYIVFRNKAFMNRFIDGKYWVRVVSTSATRSQITQLSDMINLRVSKGDVTSQINLESGRVLIDTNQLLLNASTVKFSGSAFIPDAMIQSLTASKINVGMLNAANVNIINLNANNISSGYLSSDRILANSITADKIKATSLDLFNNDSYTNVRADGMRIQGKAQIIFANWRDSTNTIRNTQGLYIGGVGNGVKHVAFTRSDGSTFMLRANSDMDYGANSNVALAALNIYDYTHVWNSMRVHGTGLVLDGYIAMGGGIQEASIQYDASAATMNFRIPGNRSGSYYWFNNKITSADGFASSSLLSLKDIKGEYQGNAVDDICSTQIVEYRYKNNPSDRQLSPIIDDVNTNKKYHLPDVITDGKTVNLYAMTSLSWLAIQQLTKRIKELEGKI